MDFTLVDGIGTAKVDETLSCDLSIDSKAFFERVPEVVEKLPAKIKAIVARAIDTKTPVKITDAQVKDINTFFMDAGAALMRQGMKRMRVCGAAKFIPPRHDPKPDK